MLFRILLILISSFLVGNSFAQSSKRKNKKEKEEQPTTIEPFYPQKDFTPKRNKTSSPAKITYNNAEEEFYDRMNALYKTRKKNEKLMESPQYSDPSYFGHKRIPKRHKPGKMKYCKVCGIRH